jgi:hypothetical protein
VLQVRVFFGKLETGVEDAKCPRMAPFGLT